MVALPLHPDRPWTIDDVARLPEDGNRYELLQGEIIASPSPGRTHQRILRHLFIRLYEAASTGEVILKPMDVMFSPYDLVEPDLLYIRDEQADQYGETRFDGAPAFVVEIDSPTSGHFDKVRKTALYMNRGVEEYWIVDSENQRILVHKIATINSAPQVFTSGMLTSIVVPSFEVEISSVFAAANNPRR